MTVHGEFFVKFYPHECENSKIPRDLYDDFHFKKHTTVPTHGRTRCVRKITSHKNANFIDTKTLTTTFPSKVKKKFLKIYQSRT